MSPSRSDPRTGALYETEDNFNFPSGFYRMTPRWTRVAPSG
jgi:hypothetical protein